MTAGSASSVAFASADSYWVNGITADASGLYFVDWATNAVYRASLDGGSKASVVVHVTGNTIPDQIGMDDCNVYWTDANGTGATQQVLAAPK